jgi:hypothetical protein
MFELILIPHKEVNSSQLEEIIKVKSKAWPYSFDKQLEWISANLKETDIHVLLFLNETCVAYLNLIVIEFMLDGIVIDGFGIGNVCAIEKGNGYGKEIITQTNLYLVQRNKIGLLFCKNNLINFYNLYDWKLIEKKKLTLLFDNESIETMIFNSDMEFHILKYFGRPF